MNVTNNIAKYLDLKDDASPYGGKSFADETLHDFISELAEVGEFKEYCKWNEKEQDWEYSIPRDVISKALRECHLLTFSELEIEVMDWLVKNNKVGTTLKYYGYVAYYGCYGWIDVPIEECIKEIRHLKRSDGQPYDIPTFKRKVKRQSQWWSK